MDRVEILKVMVVEKPFQQCVALVSLWNLVVLEIMTVMELEVEVSLSMEKPFQQCVALVSLWNLVVL